MKFKPNKKAKEIESENESAQEQATTKIHNKKTTNASEPQEKKVLPKVPTKIETYELDKERLKEKIQKALAQKPQQSSLQSFLKPPPKQKVDEKKFAPKLEPTIQLKPSEPLHESRKAVKIQQGKEQKSQQIDKVKIQQGKEQKNQWIEKVKAIKVIKGYEVRGDDIYYDVEVWDKNGQSFFVPPMSSEMVRKVDNLKVAIFLEECLMRGYQSQNMERE